MSEYRMRKYCGRGRVSEGEWVLLWVERVRREKELRERRVKERLSKWCERKGK